MNAFIGVIATPCQRAWPEESWFGFTGWVSVFRELDAPVKGLKFMRGEWAAGDLAEIYRVGNNETIKFASTNPPAAYRLYATAA
jgi:hypothetical protein